MRRLRSLPVLSLVVAVALAACGGDETKPGVGGTGGTGGDGGGGGACESAGGKPRACSVDPDRGPEGGSVKIEGVNFPTSLSKVRVKFNGLAGSVTSVDDVGGAWIMATVPSRATSGVITLELDSGNGFVTVTGPNFTVTDDRPVPVLNSISPASSTAGEALTSGITLSGTGFRSSSVVELDGVRVDAQFLNSTSLKVTSVPAAKLATAGTFSLQVINEPPGGGTSGTIDFKVVSALRVVSAEAVGASRVRVTFDRPVNRGDAAPNRNADRVYSFSPSLTVKDAQMDAASGNRSVFVNTTGTQRPDTDYTITVTGNVTSAEGGLLRDPKSAAFRGFNSTPVADGVFGTVGCGATSLSSPMGLAVLGTDLYVTEESGNQVQRISIAGATPEFLGFYGSDGTAGGYHTAASAIAAGCPGGAPESLDSLAGPRGAPGIDPVAGDVYVADTARDRIVRFKNGKLELVKRGDDYLADKDKWTSPVVLGAIGSQVLIAASDEKIHRLAVDGTRESEVFGGRGFGAGNFRFNLSAPPDDCQVGEARLECSYDGGGMPSMGWDPASKFAYVSEPGNHRVQRLKVDTANSNRLASSGAIGSGVTKFGSQMPAERAGTGNGEFTRPSGVAVDASGFIYVADEAGTGRVQRFDSSGTWLRTMQMNFVPGGLVVDRENRLWVADPVGGRVLRFKL